MGIFSKKDKNPGTEVTSEFWNILTDEEDVEKILEASCESPQLVYKHSHTCSICFLAKEEIEQNIEAISKKADMHFVNVIKARPVSSKFAEVLNVRHESPQVLIIEEGEVVAHESHHSINGDAIIEVLQERNS